MTEPTDTVWWRSFFEHHPGACFVAQVVRAEDGRGAGWRFLKVNAEWERLTGKTKLEGEGQLNTDVFPGTRPEWLNVFAEMVDSGQPTTFIRRTEVFGGWFEVSAYPLQGELFAAVFTDATQMVAQANERERADRDLQAANNLLSNVFEQAPAFICALRGPTHVFEMVNERYTRLVGGRTVVGLSVSEALPEVVPQGFVDILESVYANDEPFVGVDVAISLETAHGGPLEERFLDFVYLPLHDATGAVTGILFHGVDQTSRKRAEDELRAVASELSEMDRRKSDFLATLAHKLRNPLAPLRNGLQIMRMASDDPSMVGRARDMMERQVASLVRLVDDLLDVARISGGKIELRRGSVTIQEVVARAVETSTPAIEAQRHQLRLHIPAEPVTVDVDATRLSQVLANLLGNAAKYTLPGGQVEVSVGIEQGQAVIEVGDNGIGIPPESLPTVFEMFTQVRENLTVAQGGLGIGLALSRKLVELHGGTIGAESEGAGRGSRFVIRLPLATSPPDSRDATSREASRHDALRSLRILVDDAHRLAAAALHTSLGAH